VHARLDLAARAACNAAHPDEEMEIERPQFEMLPGGLPAPGDEARPRREYQELWFSLARLHWASVVLVPADHGGSAVEVATSLADVGTRLRDTPVTAIVANRVDYAAARALADLQPRLHRAGPWRSGPELEAHPAPGAGERGPEGAVHQGFAMPPIGRAIIAIQPVVDEPLGVAVAQAADAVVLCVRLCSSRLGAARRTIELIGAERVIGAVLVP
jgi:hypothetical protein